MKSKFLKLTALAMFLFILSVTVLTACAPANGKNGIDGINGVNGIDGIDGINGTDGADGKDGSGSERITINYKGLDKDSVFTDIVYHDFYHLLSNPRVVPGSYLVFIGGTWDINTQGVIALVDETAKEYGIKDIYLFDPKLDAGLSEKIVGIIGKNAANPDNIGKIGYTYNNTDYLYDDLEISKYRYNNSTLLNNLEQVLGETKIAKNSDGTVKTPQLLLIEREEESSANVAAYRLEAQTAPSGSEGSAAREKGILYDAVYNSNATRYEPAPDINDEELLIYGDDALKKEVFSKPQAKIKSMLLLESFYSRPFVPSIDSVDFIAKLQNFFSDKVDVTALKKYDVFTVKNQAQASEGGTTRLKENTNFAGNTLFKTLTFENLIKLFEKDGEHFIFWGGMWCPNSAVYFAPIQAQAVKSGFDKEIYLFDPKLDGNGKNIRSAEAKGDILSSGTHSRLYAYIIDNYLSDYVSRWNTDGSLTRRALGIKNTGNNATVSINNKDYTRIGVPNIAIYNKAVEGGIIDAFESELSWAPNNNNTGNTKSKDSVSYKFRKINLENLFAKKGLSENFISSGYNFSVSFRGLDITYKAYKSSTDYFNATSYYYSTAAEAELYPQGYIASGSVVNYQGLGRYLTSLSEAQAKNSYTKKSGAGILYKAEGGAISVLQSILGWNS